MTQSESNGYHIRITGLVQGVGFRPFVWRVAHELSVRGHVLNDGEGVLVEVYSDEPLTRKLADRIQSDAPPLSRIENIALTPVYLTTYPTTFAIVESQSSTVRTGCPPDAATCKDCQQELFTPQDRRYRYPFLNCTNCGPRLSIIKALPYDRTSTTMADFSLCGACLKEYHDPADRRFHAQPVACPACGPELWLEDNRGERMVSVTPFDDIAGALTAGKIVAMKGLGGFHLLCDATSQNAVARLRERKRRPHKAFALMMKDSAQALQYTRLSDDELHLLCSPQAPVVLAYPTHNAGAKALADNIAPDTNRLGIMLPYTPIHLLLMDAVSVPLVMTSGNASGRPQAIDNEDARTQLADIADFFVMHNRPIHNRVDDSVLQVGDGKDGLALQPLRLARGYAPRVLPLPDGFPVNSSVLALGAELKNTFCITQGTNAIISQHMGDLSDARTFDAWEHTLSLFRNLYQFTPAQISCDMHPDYLSSRYAARCAEEASHPFHTAAPVTQIQHHHAHMASCMGENSVGLGSGSVIGICLDGTGLGADGLLWGGEVLLGDYAEVTRIGGLKAAPLPGGSQAILAPWRCLFGQLYPRMSEQEINRLADFVPELASPTATTLARMIDKQLNCPLSSSAGRLFDAVAALLGCYAGSITYEGQAAVALQKLAESGQPLAARFTLAPDKTGTIDPSAMLEQIIMHLHNKEDRANIAHSFHLALAQAFTSLAVSCQSDTTSKRVALSGGVMQNTLLLKMLRNLLEKSGYSVLTHRQVPANDAGIAFGQALITLARSADQ